jgi:outer membrane protein assembly factor BamB
METMSDQTLMDFSDYTYETDLHSQLSAAQGIMSLAFPISDLNQDNATDLLVLNITSDPETYAFRSEISAMSGRNGSVLWAKDYPDSLAFASPAGDLNGDGRTDIMVDVVLAGTKFIPYSSIAVLDGSNGTEIWSKPQIFAVTFAYPAKDTTGDNASEFIVHVFGIDSLNNTVATKIALVSGADGTELDARIFPGAVAIEYPAGNFTGDLLQDSIDAVYGLNESSQDITTTIAAIDSSNRSTLWHKTFSCLALAAPAPDLNGDGKDELVVYLMSFANNTTSSEIAVIQGADGRLLWQKSFGSSLAFATAGPDLTGDGKKDLIVYRLGESGDNEVQAVKGDDGKLLWSKTGMIIMPYP